VESDAPPKGHRKNLPESTRRSTSPTQSQNENRWQKRPQLAPVNRACNAEHANKKTRMNMALRGDVSETITWDLGK
jgi:hypothetical protein